ncbi:MAG: M48 family metallopeptidase [Burkholderiales bacterium]
MNTFSLIFLGALLLTTGAKMWLSWRHYRHIGANRNSVPGEFSHSITLDAHQKAADYSRAKTRINMIDLAIDALLLLLFTLGGGLRWLDGIARNLAGDSLWHGVLLALGVVIVSGIINLPLSLYRTFGIEARFGFNQMTVKIFVVDLLKQTVLGAVIGIPLILAALWMMNSLGGYWWLYAWLGWMAFNVILLAIFPTWIAPLFNKFSPLENQDLKTRIELLLDKCGFRAQGLFVMDGSKRSSHGNAYFTGFGKTKRIVFFDTLLTRLSTEEIEAVLAHELGHFKRRHVIKRIALSFALSLIMLGVLGFLMKEEWFYQGLNAGQQSTGMALILFFMVMPVFMFFLQPLSSFYSRKHEFEADQYAAEQTSAENLVTALVKLYKDNASTLTPDPLHSMIYDSHPPAAVRVANLRRMSHT